MINIDNILERFDNIGLWCGGECEPNDLAKIASSAIDNNISIISVIPDSVEVLWPWIENKNVNILSRFYFDGTDPDACYIISENVNYSLKKGGEGVQIFLSLRDLEKFVSQMYSIRDDLFFNKSLFIGIDINEVGPFDWNNVFALLKKLRVTGLILVLTKDNGDKSDFVGRIYAALNTLDKEYSIKLHFVLGNSLNRIEQTSRLISSMRPEILSEIKFFVKV